MTGKPMPRREAKAWRVAAACLAMLWALVGAAHVQDAGWRRYVNERFGTSIEYPAAIFSPEPPPENGDGRKFKARDGAELTISASYNALSQTVELLEQFLRAPGSGEPDDYANVTYRLGKGDALVLSGFRGDKIFYEKFLFAAPSDVIHHYLIIYPRSSKAAYDPIVQRMAKTMTYAR